MATPNDRREQAGGLSRHKPDAQPPGRQEAAQYVANRSWRILVVDHQQDAADTLASVLRLNGHIVVALYDGRTAASASASFRPEIAIVDTRLPWTEAEDVCRAIRGLACNASSLYAIAMGNAETERLRAGPPDSCFDVYLPKPVDIGLLTRMLLA